MSLDIVSREVWQAREPRETVLLSELRFPITNIFFTFTNTANCETLTHCSSIMKFSQEKAMRFKFLEDTYYNFCIGGDGRVYEGRGWLHAPQLPRKYESQQLSSIYVGFLGQFKDSRPSEAMRKARYGLIEHGISTGQISPNYEKQDIILRSFFKPQQDGNDEVVSSEVIPLGEVKRSKELDFAKVMDDVDPLGQNRPLALGIQKLQKRYGDDRPQGGPGSERNYFKEGPNIEDIEFRADYDDPYLVSRRSRRKQRMKFSTVVKIFYDNPLQELRPPTEENTLLKDLLD